MDRSGPAAADESGARGRTRRGSGLSARLVAGTTILVILIGASFAGLLGTIVQLRSADDGVSRSIVQLRAADRLAQLLIDMESGLRGFVITGEDRFLQPWNEGRLAFPAEAQDAADLAAAQPAQAARLQAITDAGTSYIEDYGVPLVDAKRRGDPSASSVTTTQAGKARVDALRAQFADYAAAEEAIYVAGQDAAGAATHVATVGAALGLGASVLLIIVFTIYLGETVVRPVTQAADMAGRLAAGDLSTRMPETGSAEIAKLGRSFNSLAASLEGSRAAQQRLLDQQSALRRVATLVATGVEPDEVFAAVVRELDEHLPAQRAFLGRYEADETMTALAGWTRGEGLHVYAVRVPVDYENVVGRVRQTGTTARMDPGAGGSTLSTGTTMVRFGSSVACPIVVGGRPWGVLAAAALPGEGLPADAEAWMTAFTELVGTAIANADARTELAASRARVVAASDDTRRRIERNLHDGAQQRLVSVGLRLRSVESALPPGRDELRADVQRIAQELNGVIDDLREISRGIYPAILSRGGLQAAIRTLARRSAVPVELDLQAEAHYPEPIEVAGYYLVAEALTNAAKHAAAQRVEVSTAERDDTLHVTVSDDGVGGADPLRGSGLTGLRDRCEAVGGRLEVASPPGQGTRLIAEFPLTAPQARKSAT